MATRLPVPKGMFDRNRRLLTTLYRGVTGPFSVQEAADSLSFSVLRTHRFLAYLADRGWLVRVRRGLYAPIPLDAFDPWEWREDPWVIAAKLYGPAYYIGGWTACEHWNLTERIFRETVVVTTRRVRSKETEIQGFAFRVKRTGAGKTFGTRSVWRDQARVNLSDPSRTVVDILDEPSLGGGIRHVAEMVDAYFASEHRDDTLIEDYARRLGNRTVFKRLGYLIETFSIQAPALYQECRARVSLGVGLLDPSLPDEGPVLRRWNLRLNGTIQSAD